MTKTTLMGFYFIYQCMKRWTFDLIIFKSSVFVDSSRFALISPLDGRALQSQGFNGDAEMWTFDMSNARQLWSYDDYGRLINAATGKALSASGAKYWKPDDQLRIIDNKMPWRGLDRGAGQHDGSLVRTWNSRQWKRQRWISIPSNQKERIESEFLFHDISIGLCITYF